MKSSMIILDNTGKLSEHCRVILFLAPKVHCSALKGDGISVFRVKFIGVTLEICMNSHVLRRARASRVQRCAKALPDGFEKWRGRVLSATHQRLKPRISFALLHMTDISPLWAGSNVAQMLRKLFFLSAYLCCRKRS